MEGTKLIVKFKKWVSWSYFEMQHKTGQRAYLYLAYTHLFLNSVDIEVIFIPNLFIHTTTVFFMQRKVC